MKPSDQRLTFSLRSSKLDIISFPNWAILEVSLKMKKLSFVEIEKYIKSAFNSLTRLKIINSLSLCSKRSKGRLNLS
jgi:hypothetical protein